MSEPDMEPKFRYRSRIEYNSARGCWDITLVLSGFPDKAGAQELERGIRSGFDEEAVFVEAKVKDPRH